MQRQLACVTSCNRKFLESQQCLLTKSVLSVRMKTRITHNVARLLDPVLWWDSEDLHVPASLLIMQCREHFIHKWELQFLLEPQALFLRPNLITHLQYVLMLIDTLQSCMPSSDSKNKPYLRFIYETSQRMEARGKYLFYHHVDNPSKIWPRKL